MPLIRAVEIENFRSIRKLSISELSAYMPIIGLNSSGKSNVLRALNLFFNGVVDEDNGGLVLSRDYSDYAPKGKKRVVSVAVEFELGSPIKVRGQETFLQGAGLSDHIVVRRSWSADPQSRDLVESFAYGGDFTDLQSATVEQVPNMLAFIRAIIFRYVPNHVRPSDLITRLLRPLRGDLVARLQATKEYKESSVDELMSGLVRMGNSMFESVSKRVNLGLSQLNIAADLPSDFAELAFEVALSSISETGIARPPDLEGSGTQAFLLLHVLDLADRAARRGGFGWVQGTMWAFEEPESFLHAGLRSRFSKDFADYATEPRRQIMATTHHDEFVRVGEWAWLATRSAEGTSLAKLSAKDAVTESNKRAISTFRHPLLDSPEMPLVLAEGKSDVAYLRAAISQAGLRPRWRIASPDDDLLDGSSGDALKPYLQWNSSALASRPDRSPVIVLRDWEAKDARSYNKSLKVHPYSVCVTCPPELANPDLGKTFAGIERFLPTALIEKVIGTNKLGTGPAAEGSPYAVERSVLEAAKQKLLSSVEGGADVGPHMQKLAAWLNEEVENALAAVPADAFI